MRRAITGLLCLLLLLCTCYSMHHASDFQRQCQSVSLRYAEPLPTETVLAARGKGAGLAFWEEGIIPLSSTYRQSEATALFYQGDPALVWNLHCQVGALPAPLDRFGCAISTSLAQALFGSSNAVGLTFSYEDTRYTIRGVFANSDLLVLLPCSTKTFSHVELACTDDTFQDPDGWVSSRLQKLGLPMPQHILFPYELSLLMQCFAWCPLIFAGFFLLFTLGKYIHSWPSTARDCLIFGLLLAVALSLPWFFSVWPQWLTPSHWSDFSWWQSISQQLRQHAISWLQVSPTIRDVSWKLSLLAQVGRALVQLLLCECLRCRFCATEYSVRHLS